MTKSFISKFLEEWKSCNQKKHEETANPREESQHYENSADITRALDRLTNQLSAAEDRQKASDNKQDANEKCTIRLLLLTVIITGLTYYVFLQQLNFDEMKGHQELRAYISLDLKPMIWPPDNPNRWAISLVIANSGKTWARNLTILKAAIPEKDVAGGDPFNFFRGRKDPLPMSIAPGQAIILQFDEIKFSELLNARGKNYIAWVQYDDIFSSSPRWQTQIARVLNTDIEGGKESGGHISFSIANKHNCADEDCKN